MSSKPTQILAIDPGTTHSAFVVIDSVTLEVVNWDSSCENEELSKALELDTLYDSIEGVLAIEMVACYGMPVGEEIFETCVWIGRFVQSSNGPYSKVYRKRAGDVESVAMHLCKNNRAKDPNIRQAIIDKYPPTGGGKCKQIGTKKEPGPLYGIKSHAWFALAVAITYAECTRKIDDFEDVETRVYK